MGGGSILRTLVIFWRGLLSLLLRCRYTGAPRVLDGESVHTKVHLYGLALALRNWGAPHYASKSFGAELNHQFSGIAIPCTGVPLTFVCYSRLLALCFLLLALPFVALLAAVRSRWHGASPSVSAAFKELLLEPRDRVSLWVLNSALTSLHARKTKAPGYLQEDPFVFVETANRLGISVAPCHKASSVVIKGRGEHRSGARFYSNAAHGGNWVIQEKLENDAFLASLLPPGAPLSTLRVVTASRGGGLVGADMQTAVCALSCALRAGRAGAESDDADSAVLFGVDLRTGLLGPGVFGSRWRRGLRSYAALREPLEPALVQHPDCGSRIAGRTIPDIGDIEALCVDAHKKIAPDVPLAAWDVALTTRGRMLLGVRFSADFSTAIPDYERYLALVDEYFSLLDCSDAAEKFAQRRLEAM